MNDSKQIKNTSRASYKLGKEGTIEVFDGVSDKSILDIWKNPSAVVGRDTDALAKSIVDMLNGELHKPVLEWSQDDEHPLEVYWAETPFGDYCVEYSGLQKWEYNNATLDRFEHCLHSSQEAREAAQKDYERLVEKCVT